MIRSILAVIAGYMVLAVVIGAVDFGLSKVDLEHFPGGPAPATRWLILELAVGVVLVISGGYITASIARGSEMKHALALGVMTSVLSVVSLVSYHGMQPSWFQLAMTVAGIPAALAGGWLKTRK